MSEIATTINGDVTRLAAGTTVANIVADRAPSPRGVAVARNLEVVPRSAWAATVLADGDEIEILTAAQGG